MAEAFPAATRHHGLFADENVSRYTNARPIAGGGRPAEQQK
jgi:hypothetical protein